jgi:16S rRNA (cytosine1402-N4)-methyltransferase
VILQKQKHENKKCIVDARMHQDDQKQEKHIPVLLTQTLQCLNPKEGDSYLDLTGGYGGHATAVIEMTKHPEAATLVDRDPAAVKSLTERFANSGAEIIHKDFLSASQKLAADGKQFDLILADLGVSSPHLNQASRGFSIQKDGPLDMRMDTTQELTAEIVINSYSEEELVRILRTYGEEPKARAISKLIVRERPVKSTKELATLVAKAWPEHSKVHPATRTFQALRVAVNDELELLRHSLPIWIEQLLAPGGRIAVISFHSLEDRIVKQAFQDAGGEDRYDATLTILTKHPVTGDEHETVFNPRARSAKLRAAAKQK